jgi:hypothetical protein
MATHTHTDSSSNLPAFPETTAAFNAALAIADTLSPQRQLKVMTAFRRDCSAYGNVRMAFTDAVAQEMDSTPQRIASRCPATPRRASQLNATNILGPWKINWHGVIGASLAARRGQF